MTDQPLHPSPREEAISCFAVGNYNMAAQLLAALLPMNTDDAMLHRLHGMALVRIGATMDGLSSLARANALAPGDAVAATWYGIGLHAAGQHDAAARVLTIATGLAPNDPAPLVHLSRALLRLDRPQDALAAARHAVTIAPQLLEAEQASCLTALAVLQAADASSPDDLAEAWLAVGLISMRLDKVMEARAAFNEALALQPLHALAQCELALVDHLCGQPVAATVRLQALLDRDPGCHPARIALASRLLLSDEVGPALSLLDAHVPPPPGLYRSHWHTHRTQGLIALGRDGEASQELDRAEQEPLRELGLVHTWQRLVLALRQQRKDADILLNRVERLALAREAGTLEQRIDVHFDLAQLHTKASRHAVAFSHLQRGHSLLKLAQPFSRDAHERYLAAIIDHFDKIRLAQGPRAETEDTVPVFIVGLPRTGTTLLEQILNAHHAVHGAGERLAIRETMMRLTGTTVASTAMQRAAVLDTATLTAASSGYLDNLHALAPTASRILDKMPDNIFQLGFISTLLPGARIICCTRDLRDVGFSIFKHRFIGHHPYAHDLADLGWYMAAQQRLLMHWQTCLPSTVMVLDHAEWIADFDTTLRRTLAFLDLSYDPACERFYEQDRRVSSASRMQVRRPINADGVGRWRDHAEQLGPMLSELPKV